MRACDGSSATFRPLKSGKFLCNQTGEVMNRKQVASRRNSRNADRHCSRGDRPGHVVSPPPKPEELPQATMSRWDTVNCPRCGYRGEYDHAGRVLCRACQRPFLAVKEKDKVPFIGGGSIRRIVW